MHRRSWLLSLSGLTVECSGAATITLTIAKDDFSSFGQSRTLTVSAGVQTLRAYRFGRLREGIIRITTTSNAKVDIVDMAADIEVSDIG